MNYEDLTPSEQEKLHEAVFEREYNPKHEDDYYNAGGFFGHWSQYEEWEKQELLSKVRGDTHGKSI